MLPSKAYMINNAIQSKLGTAYCFDNSVGEGNYEVYYKGHFVINKENQQVIDEILDAFPVRRVYR